MALCMYLPIIIPDVGKLRDLGLIGTELKKTQKNCPIFVNRSEFIRMPRRPASVLLFDPKDALRVIFYLKIIVFGLKLMFFWSPSAFRLTSDFSHFLRHYVQLWRVLLSLINPKPGQTNITI